MAITAKFDNVPIDYSWSFSDKTQKDTAYITHGYYTYPAKFIPQLAARLIEENSQENDIVVDPFVGSGTTVVEALIHNRRGIGTDINEIAALAAKVKTTPINFSILVDEYRTIEMDLMKRTNGEFERFAKEALDAIPQNERIDYWFLPQQKEKLAIILQRILEIKNQEVQNFFSLAFAQILKSCSVWMQKSVKPTRDKNKKIYNPIVLFLSHSKKMLDRHLKFNTMLTKNTFENIDTFRTIVCGDSRQLPCENGKASLVVTSPPYVTSYEYADLHQLPSLWLGYLNNLPDFRKKFIGSAHKTSNAAELKSILAENIVSQLSNQKKDEVKNYFYDMLETFIELKRVLKKNGRICVVIGNTEFHSVKIQNAQVFCEQLENIGFNMVDVICREIPSKMLPSTRNKATGKFTKSTDKSLKMAYPIEYILIMEKL